MFPGNLSDLSHRLERPCLVVGEHDRSEGRVRARWLTEVFWSTGHNVHGETVHFGHPTPGEQGQDSQRAGCSTQSDDVKIPGLLKSMIPLRTVLFGFASSGREDDLFSSP